MIQFSTSKADMSFSEGILLMKIHADEHLEIEDFKEVFAKRDELIGNQIYGVLFDGQNFHTASKETRDFLADYNPPNQVGVAVVSKVIAIRLLANFFMNVSKPKTPTKLVATKEDGKNWLNKLLKESKELV